MLLRSEAGLVLVVTVAAYARLFPGHWLFFALLFLFPDVALFASVLPKKRAAAAIYNTLHNYALPMIVAGVAWQQHAVMFERLALIWAAHIAMDRVLGFGLKYPLVFKPTHLQRVASLQEL